MVFDPFDMNTDQEKTDDKLDDMNPDQYYRDTLTVHSIHRGRYASAATYVIVCWRTLSAATYVIVRGRTQCRHLCNS